MALFLFPSHIRTGYSFNHFIDSLSHSVLFVIQIAFRREESSEEDDRWQKAAESNSFEEAGASEENPTEQETVSPKEFGEETTGNDR